MPVRIIQNTPDEQLDTDQNAVKWLEYVRQILNKINNALGTAVTLDYGNEVGKAPLNVSPGGALGSVAYSDNVPIHAHAGPIGNAAYRDVIDENEEDDQLIDGSYVQDQGFSGFLEKNQNQTITSTVGILTGSENWNDFKYVYVVFKVDNELHVVTTDSLTQFNNSNWVSFIAANRSLRYYKDPSITSVQVQKIIGVREYAY